MYVPTETLKIFSIYTKKIAAPSRALLSDEFNIIKYVP